MTNTMYCVDSNLNPIGYEDMDILGDQAGENHHVDADVALGLWEPQPSK
jgi:hypothetical protein